MVNFLPLPLDSLLLSSDLYSDRNSPLYTMEHNRLTSHLFPDPLVVSAAFAFGFTSGLVSRSKLAAKQFLAENAHRLPTTVQGCVSSPIARLDFLVFLELTLFFLLFSSTSTSPYICIRWFFYNKSKNSVVLYKGIKGGFKTGTRLALWTTAFVATQEALDKAARKAVSVYSPRGDKTLEGWKTKWAAGGTAGVGIAAAAGAFCAFFFSLSSISTPTPY